jgi:hypothetical protein
MSKILKINNNLWSLLHIEETWELKFKKKFGVNSHWKIPYN